MTHGRDVADPAVSRNFLGPGGVPHGTEAPPSSELEMLMPCLPRSFVAVAALAGALCLPGLATSASTHGVSMEVLVDGRPLRAIRTDGRTYVKARKGRSYTIRLTNETGGRVAVALAVDGLNSIDATHTSARDAAKWVLAPYETAEIKGWQVDDRNARRFVFTSEELSLIHI